MSKTICFLFTLLLLTALSGCAPSKGSPPPLFTNGKGQIVVKLSGFRNDRGLVLVSLFSSPRGFPGEPERALRNQQARILDRQASVTFDNVPKGSYALSVLHDEDSDGSMATGWLGVPAEGYAVSNNVVHRFSAPDFEEARFDLSEAQVTLSLSLHYVQRRGPPAR